MISCQDAIFYLYEDGQNMDISGPEMISSINFAKIELESNIPILDAVKKWLAMELINKAVNPVSFFDHAILECENLAIIDRVVFLNEPHPNTLILSIAKYRALKNPKFKAFFIGKNDQQKSTNLATFVTGCSEQVLRFMAEDGKENVFNQIVSFPAKFGIELDEFAPTIEKETLKPRIRDIKVFLSSTIRDLLKQRQEIVTTIIPSMNEKLKVNGYDLNQMCFSAHYI